MTITGGSLDARREARIAALRAECRARIVADYEHDALGSVHTYPADPESQLNAQGAVAAALAGDAADLMCADAAGTWALRAHTPAQTIAVARGWQARKQGLRHALLIAQAAVQAATTRAAVDAVDPDWPE